jgi:hypothetical protein
MARNFDQLTEREILALAIALEEEDQRVYADFADGLGETHPATAKMFAEMAEEESQRRARLIEIHRARFGEHIPHIRREDVKGFLKRKPVWRVRPLGVNVVRSPPALVACLAILLGCFMEIAERTELARGRSSELLRSGRFDTSSVGGVVHSALSGAGSIAAIGIFMLGWSLRVMNGAIISNEIGERSRGGSARLRL